MRKKLLAFAVILLGLVCLLAGAGAESRDLRTKITVPAPKRIESPGEGPLRKAMLSNYRGRIPR